MNSEPLDKSKKPTITPTLVTGFSANHFHEHTTHIENLKEKFPGQKVVVYDLGLEPDQIEFIKNMFSLVIVNKQGIIICKGCAVG